MLAIEDVVRIFVIIFLEFISFDRSYAQSQSCYDVDNKTVCYFQPTVASISLTWDEAWKYCKEHNATLPVINNQQIQEKLKSYIESKTSLKLQIWLAGTEIRTNVWQWLNGKPFGRHDILKVAGERLYYTNAVITGKLEYLPHYPRDDCYYICHCTDCILCENKKAIHFGNGCIFVNNNESLNLVNARNRCLDKGGDLATFEENEDLGLLQQNRSLLYKSKSYWIGLRLNWWIWNETDSSKEIKYSNWSKYENRFDEACLYIHLYNYQWYQSSCTVTKPFICQRVNISGTDEIYTSTPTLILHGTGDFSPGFSIELLVATIIGATVAIIVTVSLVITLKKARKKSVSSPSSDEKPALSEQPAMPSSEKSTQPVESKNTEVNEMSTYYAEIPRAVSQNNDERRNDPQSGIVYATLEFDGNKAVYEEPVISKQRTQERSASKRDRASKGNIQPGSFGAPPAQPPEVTIYANM